MINHLECLILIKTYSESKLQVLSNVKILKVVKKVGFLIVCAAVFLRGGVVEAKLIAECEEIFEQVQDSDFDLQGKIRALESHKSKCSGTGFYEYQLGSLHLMADDYEKSNEMFEEGLAHETDYRHVLLLGQGNIRFAQLNYSNAELIYKTIIDEFPNWYVGYQHLGLTLVALEEFQKAINILKSANMIQPHAETFRNLVLAYESTGQYELAIKSLDDAYSLDATVVEDKAAILAIVRSYANIGKYQVARDFLVLLLQGNPDIMSDEEYVKTGFFLKEKMIESGYLKQED